MFRRLFSVMGILWLAGCSTIPDSIQVADDSQLAEYNKVSQLPDQNIAKEVRWGGVIASVENLQDVTRLDIVQYPLRSYGRPLTNRESEGRFRVYVDGFLDPLIYEKGRAVTVTGKIVGAEDGMVGEHNYQFPTVKADGYHLWKKIQRVIVNDPFWPNRFGPGWGWGWPYFYGPRPIFWGGGIGFYGRVGFRSGVGVTTTSRGANQAPAQKTP